MKPKTFDYFRYEHCVVIKNTKTFRILSKTSWLYFHVTGRYNRDMKSSQSLYPNRLARNRPNTHRFTRFWFQDCF